MAAITFESPPIQDTSPQEGVGPVTFDTPPEKKEGWVSTQAKEFWSSLTSQSIPELMKSGMLPNLAKGIGRIAYEHMMKQAIPEVQDHYVPQKGFRKTTQQEFKETGRISVPIEKPVGTVKLTKQMISYMKKHPGATLAEFAKGVVQDPELLIPITDVFGGGAKISQILANIGAKAGRVGEISGATIGRMGVAGAEGAAIGAGISGAEQFKTGRYNPEEIAQQAAITGALSSFLGVRRDMIPPKELKAANISEKTASELIDRFKSEGGDTTNLTPKSVKEFADADINAEKAAYNLVNKGASSKEVEAATKKNPLVGKKIDEIMASRAEYTKRFRKAPIKEEPVPITEPRALPMEHIEAAPAPVERVPPITEQQLTSARAAEINASAESPASMEAINRLAAESAVGQDRFKINTKDGTVTPLVTADRVDARPNANEIIVQRGIGKDPYTILDKGENVNTGAIEGSINRAIPSLESYHSAKFKQSGGIDPRVVAGLSATGMGAAIGAYNNPQNPTEGAVVGAVLGYAGARVAENIPSMIRGVKGAWDKIMAPDDRIRISELANKVDGDVAVAQRTIWKVQKNIAQLVPEKANRENLSHYLEGDKTVPVTPGMIESAKLFRAYMDHVADLAIKAGVIKGALQDYVTHVVDFGAAPKSKVDAFIKSIEQRASGAPTTSSFAKQRVHATLRDLEVAAEKHGFRIKTKDAAEIVGIYGNSMEIAVARKNFLNALKKEKVKTDEKPEGMHLYLPADKAPSYYVPVDHPSMIGMRVHPDIEPSVKAIFDSYDPSMISKLLLGVALSTKRVAVSMSLFHLKSLIDAGIGAGVNPFKIPSLLKLYREGEGKDIIELGLRGGLKIGLPDDVSVKNMHEGLAVVGDMVDKIIPLRAGTKTLETAEKATQVFDKATWDFAQTGYKLVSFVKNYNILRINNDRLALKRPELAKSDEQIAAMAASFSNDIFGGLNWRRIAEDTNNRIIRDLAFAIARKRSRAYMQIMMFAPDWTISTTRAFLKGMKRGSGIKGIFKPTELADLHHQYLLRSTAYYMTIGNALNYAMSGHYIWDNEDKTQLELGDGRTMQFSKHFMEPVHWITKQWQQALNKMGTIPSELLEQALGKEWLSSGGAPPIESRLGHLGKRLMPIPGQQFFYGNRPESAAQAIGGFFGMPIYGRTEEEKRQAKLRARRKRSRSRKKDRSYGRGY